MTSKKDFDAALEQLKEQEKRFDEVRDFNRQTNKGRPWRAFPFQAGGQA